MGQSKNLNKLVLLDQYWRTLGTRAPVGASKSTRYWLDLNCFWNIFQCTFESHEMAGIVHQKCVFVGIKYEVHVGFWCILGCSSIPSAFCTEVKSCVWKCLLVKEWVRKECLREKHIRFIQSHQLLAWWPPHMKVRPALQPQ